MSLLSRPSNLTDMNVSITNLNKQEQQWILEQRILRLTDNQETLIYPMGAERYLASVLSGRTQRPYNILADINDKDILIISGYGNSAFLFAQSGAKSVTVYDKDPVTIAWVKAFKKYYHYQEHDNKGQTYPSIGDLLGALTAWYPPLLHLPKENYLNRIRWTLNPRSLRRTYIFYMLTVVQKAIREQVGNHFELEKPIQFHTGELHDISSKNRFDTAFIPYLLGVSNGIEREQEVVAFIKQLTSLVKSHVLVTPSRSLKEFYISGKKYFNLENYSNLEDIPDLTKFIVNKDTTWFKTQGLVVFTALALEK